MSLRAIVIGAGFAGLAAADELMRAGASVVVLEARDRVGGRVWSTELSNGAVVEMGAEFILPGNDVLVGLAGRLGLDLWSKGMRYGDREPRGGIGVAREELLAAVAAIENALAGIPAGASSRSAAKLLDELDLDPGAREAITARLEVSAATTADRVDASWLAGVAAHVTDECPGIAGGNQRLAIRLAERLGGAVRLSSPVARVAWGADGVLVSTADADVSADVCVVAVPASVIARIVFEPQLPPATEGAIRAVQYGHAAKLFVPLAEIPPPSAVLSVPERYWTWTATGEADAVQPVVSAFAGSLPALSALRVADGPERWLESLERLRPDLALEIAGAVLSTWDDDPWVGAAYSSRSPVAADDEALLRGVGPIHFAGEHTAGSLSGLMEGALRSGVRAARAVLGCP